MGIFAWLIIGTIAGLLAKAISPGPEPRGAMFTVILGIIGAMVGGFLFSLFGHGGVNGVTMHSILVATLGAIAALSIYKAASPAY